MGYTKVLFFYSNIWCSGCTNMRPLFFDEVHKYNMRYELIDVDTEEGAELSCKYGIRKRSSALEAEAVERGRTRDNEALPSTIQRIQRRISSPEYKNCNMA